MGNDFIVFCFNGYEQYNNSFATAGLKLLKPDQYAFEEGDCFIYSAQDLKNKHVFLVGSLNRDSSCSTNDRLAMVLFFIDSIKRSGAAKISLIAPYICYSRMENKNSGIVANDTVAKLLEAAGLDSIVTMDVHNREAFDDAYGIQSISLSTASFFCDYYESIIDDSEQICVVSPDSGGIPRAKLFKEELEKRLGRSIEFSHLNKSRQINEISMEFGDLGDLSCYTAIIYDDIVSTGKTMLLASKICKQNGASKVYGAAVHLLNQDFASNIGTLDGFIYTNSVPTHVNGIDITKLIVDYIKSNV